MLQSATPEELRGALTPGRLDAERPALRRKLGSRIVDATPVAYLSFLPDDYKRAAAEALVRYFFYPLPLQMYYNRGLHN